MRTVADRHRLAACRNKHCWRAFREYRHWWPFFYWVAQLYHYHFSTLWEPLCHTLLNRFIRCGAISCACFSSSGWCHRFHFIARITSASVIGPSFTPGVGMFSRLPSKSYNMSGSGQLRTDEKCSCHRIICCWCVVVYFPSLLDWWLTAVASC